jgi:hypothetical protein
MELRMDAGKKEMKKCHVLKAGCFFLEDWTLLLENVRLLVKKYDGFFFS